MKYTEMLQSSLSRWPDRIDISNGYVLEDGGGFFPVLSEIWDRVEREEEKRSSLHGLFSWSIFSGFHHLARKEKVKNKTEALKADLSPEVIYHQFSESFYEKENGWMKDYPDFIDDYQKTEQVGHNSGGCAPSA
ncbi:hypothetical protein QEH52_19250 [Coraliomargarita sp. SDUM461003]|uniref:DUF4375 domain-containing protein n=1 Tax=Thalassobacterium maritimum TaxID=3041265 RepID=A0ABU1B1T6_9BACT|nr:hypothetical protein [Coraliomargarita sp. SDUM461003]MDQ8209664.1 hypothetical protein [Coraliomargarita sp. SDUM461003]